MTIGESLKRFRTGRQLTLQQVATALGISYQSYQSYEVKGVNPGASVIKKMAQKFDVSADYLLGLSDEPNPKKYDDKEVSDAFALRDALRLDAGAVKEALDIRDALKPFMSK